MNEEIKKIISEYNKGYDDLQDTLREIPAEAWDFKPAKDKWSIRGIISHITDSEANTFVRCRKMIAESGSEVTPYDQDLWADYLLYSSRSIDSNLELFKNIRLINVALFMDITHDSWNRFVMHPERGKITLKDFVLEACEHIEVHIRQMKRNHDAWNANI